MNICAAFLIGILSCLVKKEVHLLSFVIVLFCQEFLYEQGQFFCQSLFINDVFAWDLLLALFS